MFDVSNDSNCDITVLIAFLIIAHTKNNIFIQEIIIPTPLQNLSSCTDVFLQDMCKGIF